MAPRCAAGIGPAPACIEIDCALAFVDGALTAAERAEVERRIDACAQCRALIAEAARHEPDSGAATLRAGAGRATHRAVPRDQPRPGESVGRYVIERALGAGGMGVVSLARDPELRRAVVIKLVRPDVAHGEGSDALEARLRREAQAMAQLSHPNVVQIFDIGRHGDRIFLAMEFVAGPTLAGWLGERARAAEDILAIARQAGAGLAAAHRVGLIHRDFKPANVLIDGDGVAKVTDFGLAREARASDVADPADVHAGAPNPPPDADGHTVLTAADAVLGTPAYMAPEQRAAGPVDARTDQYAFAVTLLDALLGQPPVRRPVAPTAPPEEVDAALARAGVATRQRAAIVRALRDAPAARFATLHDLLRALEPARRRRARWLATALAVGAGGAAVWLAAVPRDRCASPATARWTPIVRRQAVAALAAAPGPFAGWTAERSARALDADVAALARVELARCEAAPAPVVPCGARRPDALAALDRAVPALLAGAEPWSVVTELERCDDRPVPDDALARELRRGVDGARARAIAAQARTLGDDGLAAEALGRAGAAAFALGDLVTAEQDARAEDAAGERADDDAVRGRALLAQLEIARWGGDHAGAVVVDDTLRALISRHGPGTREDLVVTTAEARAFTELGDRARATSAWDRAASLAGALGDTDGALRARTGRAGARYRLQLDLATARHELDAVLASAGAASPVARADALTLLGDLALVDRDGAAAMAAFAEARRLVPARATAVVDRIRAARARATRGELEPALAELAAIPVSEPVTRDRLAIARGMILLGAGRPADAFPHLQFLEDRRNPYLRAAPELMPTSALEQLDAALAFCAAQAALDQQRLCTEAGRLVQALHPQAAARALSSLAAAREHALAPFTAAKLERALDLLHAIEAPPTLLAEVQWERAQLREGQPAVRAALAEAARAAFVTAGRTADVAAIDDWLRAQPPGAAEPR